MTFTASDVSSLAESMSRWERGEYISEAFVIIACAGELVADLGRKRLTKARRDRIERLSTILLVTALSVSLICLVRTNELSGSVIGSLGEMADRADGKAKTAIADSSTALSQAKDALTKAGNAQGSVGKAEEEADKAQAASSNALTLAHGARQEADLFEKDIASARNDLALLQFLVSARRITDPRPFEQLKKFKSKPIPVLAWAGDVEAQDFCRSISSALESTAGMNTIAGCGGLVGGGSVGVVISGPDFSLSEALAKAISVAGHTGAVATPADPKKNTTTIIVGSKNPFVIGNSP